MSTGLLCALGLIAPAAASGRPHQRWSEDGWQIALRQDGFTGQVACRLGSPGQHIVYQPGALGFRFRRHQDTLNTWYRVDNGPPIRWQDRYPTLIATGVRMDGGGLDTPTDGIVWIPLNEFDQARLVDIRVGGNRHRPRRFALYGFASALAAARRLGCASDASFAS